jgi:hypothetical protein
MCRDVNPSERLRWGVISYVQLQDQLAQTEMELSMCKKQNESVQVRRKNCFYFSISLVVDSV